MDNHRHTRRDALRLLRRAQRLGSSPHPDRDNLDRFIPNRSAMDFDFATVMLTQGKAKPTNTHPPNEAYQRGLADLFNMNPTRRILAFRNKPPTTAPRSIFAQPPSFSQPQPRKIPRTWDRMLSAPDIIDDCALNILDWGSSNLLAIALANTVYLLDPADLATLELVTLSDDQGPVTSLAWAPDGRRLAVGLNDSTVQLWDCAYATTTATLQGCHISRVGSLAWKSNHVLTTGGMDGLVVNHDTRISDDIIQRYQGHTQEIYGLKWSPSGSKLASAGNDNLIHIWDPSVASSSSPTQWLHRLREHTSAVKALAWSPYQSNLLASGGGEGDHCIKFWNAQTGARLNSINTGSQVCGLVWNKNEKRELLSSHGHDRNNLTLWKYPSLAKIAELTGHTSRVTYTTQSPDGCTVATAAGDERLMFWNVFGTPAVAAKRALKSKPEPFAHVSRIR